MPWKKVPIYHPYHDEPVDYEWVYEPAVISGYGCICDTNDTEKEYIDIEKYRSLKKELDKLKSELNTPKYFFFARNFEDIIRNIRRKCRYDVDLDKLGLDFEKIKNCFKETDGIDISIEKYGLPTPIGEYSLYNDIYVVYYSDLSNKEIQKIEYYFLPSWENYVNKFKMSWYKWKQTLQTEENVERSALLQIMNTQGFKKLYHDWENTIYYKKTTRVDYIGFEFRDIEYRKFKVLLGLIIYFCDWNSKSPKLTIAIIPKYHNPNSFEINIAFNKKSFLKRHSPYRKNLNSIYELIDSSGIIVPFVPEIIEINNKEDFKNNLKEKIKESLIYERSKLGLSTKFRD